MTDLELKISRGPELGDNPEQNPEKVPEYTSSQSKPTYQLKDPSRLLFDVLIDEEKERERLGMCLLEFNPYHFNERFAETDVEVLVYAKTNDEIDFGYDGSGFPIAEFEEVTAFDTVEEAIAGYAPLEQELLDAGKVPTMVVNINKRYGLELDFASRFDGKAAVELYQHLIGLPQKNIDKTMKRFLRTRGGNKNEK